jgi:hypothetical protein
MKLMRENSLELYQKKHGKNKDKNYDKTCFCFSQTAACHSLHDVIYLHHWDGYYGNSGVGFTFSKEMIKYIVRAANEKLEEIFMLALDIITEDIKLKIDDLVKENQEIENLISEIYKLNVHFLKK